ncbi:uncharacterized protein BXZ73DRAFT_99106 [Epithele typhae]|uniref:uncharacterized protein n=1 Tax=Epithele typhae TaxID=378194 RepID=UPI0020076950|nr:uncharacterized protein BXZ73DRAFT_107786 [Epithele typhae]XP_047880233.1 uncharacterized protein BXZ73DRAFT_99106 [Epithele typhae]KAH9911826.1 hypothetical protein BXZ73DRAFT_107786 [Epithele typhae]KAH9940108.1 hypothetical protein BXZ73DRAFT_99106 [Epithele typhae]
MYKEAVSSSSLPTLSISLTAPSLLSVDIHMAFNSLSQTAGVARAAASSAVPSGQPTPQTPNNRNGAGRGNKKRKSAGASSQDGVRTAPAPPVTPSIHASGSTIHQPLTPRSVPNGISEYAISAAAAAASQYYITQPGPVIQPTDASGGQPQYPSGLLPGGQAMPAPIQAVSSMPPAHTTAPPAQLMPPPPPPAGQAAPAATSLHATAAQQWERSVMSLSTKLDRLERLTAGCEKMHDQCRLIVRLGGGFVPYAEVLPKGLAAYCTDEFSISTHDRDDPMYRYQHNVWNIVWEHFPQFEDYVELLVERPQVLGHIANYLTRLEPKVRGDDLTRLRSPIITLAGIEDPGNNLANNKSARGFNNPHTARLLTPYYKLDEFDRDPTAFCNDVNNGVIPLRAKNFFSALYSTRDALPRQPLPGLLKGALIVKAYKAIFASPKAAMRGDVGGLRARKSKGQAPLTKKYHLTADHFSLYSVVYVASLVRFCLTSEPEWSDTDGFWDVRDFVLKLTRTAQSQKQWKAETTTWWIQHLFGDIALTVDEERTPFDDILDAGSDEEVPEGGNDGDNGDDGFDSE